MKQLNRIGVFLNSLESDGILSKDAQSLVFIPEMEQLGGMNDGCVNEIGADCKSGTNELCINGTGCGTEAKNKQCTNPGTNVVESLCKGGTGTVNACHISTITNVSVDVCKKP